MSPWNLQTVTCNGRMGVGLQEDPDTATESARQDMWSQALGEYERGSGSLLWRQGGSMEAPCRGGVDI